MTLSISERIRGTRSVSTELGRIPKTTARETWLIQSTDGSEDEYDVDQFCQAQDLTLTRSWQGRNNNTVSSLFATRITIVDYNETTKLWNVELEYGQSMPGGGGDPGTQGDNPEDQPQEVEWDTELEQYTPTHTSAGDPIVNGAGDPFDPPVVAYRPMITLRVIRWETTFSSAIIGQWVSKTNSITFAGFDVTEGFIHRISATSHYLYGSLRWRVTYQLRFRPYDYGAWTFQPLNYGPNYLDAAGTQRQFIKDEPGVAAGWLKSDGSKGSPGELAGPFEVYSRADFNILLPGF